VNTASIAKAKDRLSELIRRVKRGETILITDRNHPVARLAPVANEAPAVAALIASGVLRPPTGTQPDPEAFLAAPRPPLASAASLSEAVLAERREGR
jgi:prevent-host-death family protein